MEEPGGLALLCRGVGRGGQGGTWDCCFLVNAGLQSGWDLIIFSYEDVLSPSLDGQFLHYSQSLLTLRSLDMSPFYIMLESVHRHASAWLAGWLLNLTENSCHRRHRLI